MKEYLKEKIVGIVDDKLNSQEIDDLITFFRCLITESIDSEGDHFYKDLAFEMSGSVKELALLIIDFRKDLQSKIHPEITDLTTKYIPQAADQLEGVIETTETAANKIMDNLEFMQEHTCRMEAILADLEKGKFVLPDEKDGHTAVKIDDPTLTAVLPLVTRMIPAVQDHMNLISDTFVQMSFQDLTGQRIKRIMGLVRDMETKLKKMVVSFGIKVAEKEKNPEISFTELQKAVNDKVSELAGPQKIGCGLDQAGIDEILAGI